MTSDDRYSMDTYPRAKTIDLVEGNIHYHCMMWEQRLQHQICIFMVKNIDWFINSTQSRTRNIWGGGSRQMCCSSETQQGQWHQRMYHNGPIPLCLLGMHRERWDYNGGGQIVFHIALVQLPDQKAAYVGFSSSCVIHTRSLRRSRCTPRASCPRRPKRESRNTSAGCQREMGCILYVQSAHGKILKWQTSRRPSAETTLFSVTRAMLQHWTFVIVVLNLIVHICKFPCPVWM